MKSVLEIPDIPRHISLSSQAAVYIRKRIEEGMWHERLPSERKLAEILQISRPTVRMALHQLGTEGLLYMQPGRRNRMLLDPFPARAIKNRQVGLITHEPFSAMATTSFRWVSKMREYLFEQGVRMEVFICKRGSTAAERKRIEAFLQHNNISCCLLLSVSKEVQRWFSEHKVPALVSGSCHSSVSLPSLDVDYRSICRHAAGLFLRKKHRNITLVVPNSGYAGDIAGEQGFREAAAEYPGARAMVVRHNSTVRNITAQLDTLFNSKEPPTALLVARPVFVFTVIVYLLKRGLSVPDQVSLIARDADARFEFSEPMISHYLFDTDVYAHKLARLILKLANNEELPRTPHPIFPKFVEGGSVAPLAVQA